MAWVQLALLILATVTMAGCELATGIFKAGAWVGALAVIFVVGAIAFLVAKIRS
jgi:hypothetical protein